MNVLIPAMGTSTFFENYFFPKLMVEINGKTMLEHLVHNYKCLEEKRFIFVFDQKDVLKFHLDESVRLITDEDTVVISLANKTKGALCTALMAIEYIDGNDSLIISNSDQIIDVDYTDIVKTFDDNKCDAGIIVFSSVHPRWSYAKVRDNTVYEVSEKRPFSKNAIAGFYYYKQGSDYCRAAEKAIEKNSSYDGQFFISASLNEMILMGKRVGIYEVDNKQYHSFYSPQKIDEYETYLTIGETNENSKA